MLSCIHEIVIFTLTVNDFMYLDMKNQPLGSHAMATKMRSLRFKSPPNTAKYDATSLMDIRDKYFSQKDQLIIGSRFWDGISVIEYRPASVFHVLHGGLCRGALRALSSHSWSPFPGLK